MVSLVAVAAAAFVAGALVFRHRAPPIPQSGGTRRILYYRSAMDPQMTSPTPKKDPMGMDYVPVYADEAGGNRATGGGPPLGAGPNAVQVSSRVVQETGVTTERAELRSLSRTIRTVGIVRPDERRLYSVNVKFAGWVERLFVNFTGERVRRGAPLATIYSPDLLATQREYLLAVRYARSVSDSASQQTRDEAASLLQSARRRLLLWDIPEHEIEDLERRGEPTRSLMIHSPADGTVLEKNVTAGTQVQPGMALLRIADLRDIWVFAQVYPHELSWVREGQRADLQVPGIPGKALSGRVDFIQPVVSLEARTIEVRIQVAQPAEGIVLKPNMYANVEIRSPIEERVLAIPEQAVIRTGERNVAIVALGDGYFEPRDLKLGSSGSGYIEVLDGIKPSEQVVTSSQFLLDSESNLRSALGAMSSGGGHAGHANGGSQSSSTPAHEGPGQQRSQAPPAASPPPSQGGAPPHAHGNENRPGGH